MKPLTALLVTGSLVILLTGCTAYKHNKAGDAAAATGDMRSAVYHYERALANKDKYARDADFLTKLATARSRVAYDDAQQLRMQGRYEPAIERLREAMRQDPAFTEPAALLPSVLKEAAQWRYSQAIKAADHGDLAAARDHLTRSLQHDMTDDAVADAMASLSPDRLNPQTPGLLMYQEGLSLSADRRWIEAEQALLKSVAANGNLLPARAALHDARTQLAESRRLERDGRLLIGQLTMGPAIKSLQQSLNIWPGNTQASELLEQAKAQRALADKQFELATQAAGQTKWDDAIALADSGLAIDRSHPGLEELRSALPRRAAADFTKRGDAHLDKDELDDAHRSYSRALSYRSTHRDARVGIASVYEAWAAQYEQAGQLGAALLQHHKGRSYARSKANDEGIVRLRAALQHRLGVGLSVSTQEQGRGAIDPRQLNHALLGSLGSSTSRGLSIQDQGADYALKLTIRKATIDERMTNVSHRTHRYTTQELHHNPEYDRVARCYDRECATLRHLEAELAAYRCRGHLDKSPCDCFNSNHYNHLKRQVSNQRRVVSRAKHELSCTPREIRVTVHHEWPYTVETYHKSGELTVATELIDTASGKTLKSLNHQASFSQTDDRTLNANPSVGVREDHLRLQSDEGVSQSLTDELASAAGPWAVNALIDHKLTQVNTAIDTFEDKGDTAAALEARVDRAVLLGLVDPKASQEGLDKLTESHTR